ncbi:hypothetical protein KO465_05800 [Candidatus Micrarchaeota archaeon]|nr:hypothetical protein [Candidatus Micrarchaeota archaeon]
MINLSWKTRKPPAPERRERGDEQRAKVVAQKVRERSIRYCQRCGKSYYPEEKTKTVEIDGNWLVVCKQCGEELKK